LSINRLQQLIAIEQAGRYDVASVQYALDWIADLREGVRNAAATAGLLLCVCVSENPKAWSR